MARTLLLVVSLGNVTEFCTTCCHGVEFFILCYAVVCVTGYGIVRPKLLPTEWISIAVVTVLYFIAGECLTVMLAVIRLLSSLNLNSFAFLSYDFPSC